MKSLWFDAPESEILLWEPKDVDVNDPPMTNLEPDEPDDTTMEPKDVDVNDPPMTNLEPDEPDDTTMGWYMVHTASNARAYAIYGLDSADAIANFRKAFGITSTQLPIEAHLAAGYVPSTEDTERHDAINAPPPPDAL